MPIGSELSNVSRRQFLTTAGGAAATSMVGTDWGQSPPPPCSCTANSHTIKIIRDPTQGTLTYTDSVPGTKPSALCVCPGDQISWNTDLQSAKHTVCIVFPGQSPFQDAKNNPIYAFKWTEKEENNGAGGGPIAAQNGSFKYCVALFDESGPSPVTYFDDPTLIVGGKGNATADIDQARIELNEVVLKMKSIDNLLSEALVTLDKKK